MRLSSLVIACVTLALNACGGSKGGGSQPVSPHGAHGTHDDVAHDTLGPESDAGVTPPTSSPDSQLLAAEDCDALLDHIFAIVYGQQSRDLPEAQRPSPEDLKVAKDNLRKELVGQCVGANREVFKFDCAMAAQSHQALAACMGEPAGK